MAKEKNEAVLPPGAEKGAIRDNVEVICFAVLLIMFFKTFVAQQFTIPSGSMRNTLMIGDHLMVNKFLFAKPQWALEEKLFPMRDVKRGDIIVFRFPLNRDQDYVKRCVALPGDKVEIRQKRLYVNDKLITGEFEHHVAKEGEQPDSGPWPLERNAGENIQPDRAALWPFLDPAVVGLNRQGLDIKTLQFRDELGSFTVPQGHLFAMGDNRDNSEDSRYWGFVPIDHLRGRPFLVWWSYQEGGDDDTHANVPNGPGDVIKNIAETVRYFFHRTRWERTGEIPE